VADKPNGIPLLSGNRKLSVLIGALLALAGTVFSGEIQAAQALMPAVGLILGYFTANVGEHAAKRNQPQ